MENPRPDMHIGMILHGHYLSDSRVRREAETLARAGHCVDVICVRVPNKDCYVREPLRETVANVRITRLPIQKKRGNFFRYLIEYVGVTVLGFVKLTMLHMAYPFDVVHAHNMPDILAIAGIVPKLFGARLLLDVHDPMVEHFRATYHLGPRHLAVYALRFQERLAYCFVDNIVSVSDTMKEHLTNNGILGRNIFIVHNFPDTAIFRLKQPTELCYTGKREVTLLYCGTVTEHYRLDIAVRALACACQTVPALRLKILGGGNRLGDIKELAKELKIDDKIEYMRPVSLTDVPGIMQNVDIVISSHQAGIFGDLYFSTKVLEAMTQAIPVVCSRTATLTRYIPEDAIFYFEPENVDDMANQIVRICRDPKTANLKRNAASKLAAKLTWESEGRRLVEFYRTLKETPSVGQITQN